MTNPWLRKNPYMSMWLSGANSVANTAASTARAKVTAEARRQSNAAIDKAMADAVTFWTGGFFGVPASRTGRKRRR